MKKQSNPTLIVAAIPVVLLIATLITTIVLAGASAVTDYGMYALLASGIVAIVLAVGIYQVPRSQIVSGLKQSASQMLPCVPLLLLIGSVSASWMLSGVVPYLVKIGIQVLNPSMYLMLTCLSCAVVSSLIGSSWTTIATLGVAFLGIGSVFGYDPAWSAGAIISGAYFGDKVSPLSDTTVVASATTEVEILDLVKYMFITTIPAFVVSLLLFWLLGSGHDTISEANADEMLSTLDSTFNITPWVLVIPAFTVLLVILRRSTIVTLILSTVAGIVGMLYFQPHLMAELGAQGGWATMKTILSKICFENTMTTGHEAVDNLVSTGGMAGMTTTIILILCAMIFGGAMMGTGFLERLTRPMSTRLARRHSVVGATIMTGVTMNALTADQYVSIIISGNVFKPVYKNAGLPKRLLGRSIQDAVPTTSALIPWNSCGVTQSTVLGVATLAYLPFCFFNLLSPFSSLLVATITYHRRKKNSATPPAE